MKSKIHTTIVVPSLFLISLIAVAENRSIDFRATPLIEICRAISNDDLNIIPSLKAQSKVIDVKINNATPREIINAIAVSHELVLKESDKYIYVFDYTEKEKVAPLEQQKLRYILKVKKLENISSDHAIRVLKGLFAYQGINTDASKQEIIQDLGSQVAIQSILESQARTKISLSQDDESSDAQGGGEGVQTQSTSSSDENEAILLDEDLYIQGMKADNLVLLRSTNEDLLSDVLETLAAIDKPVPQVKLDVEIVSISLDASFQSFFDLSWNNGKVVLNSPSNILESADPSKLIASFVDSEFNLVMAQLKKDGKAQVVSSPNLTAQNRHICKFFIGDQNVPLLVGFEPGETTVNESTTVVEPPTPNYQLIDVGTSLLITPIIHNQNKLSLKIAYVESDLKENSHDILIPEGSSLTSETVDVVSTQNYIGSINVLNNQTIAIGGIVKTVESEEEQGIPILKDIPILGYPFKDIKKVKSKSELVIFIKPSIYYEGGEVKDKPVYESQSEDINSKGNEK